MTASYFEEGWEARVHILDDTSDEEFERYKLRVVHTVEESELLGPIEDGKVFDVIQKRGEGTFELIKT